MEDKPDEEAVKHRRLSRGVSAHFNKKELSNAQSKDDDSEAHGSKAITVTDALTVIYIFFII